MAKGDAHSMEDTTMASANMYSSLNSDKQNDTFVPEDVEWADSCLEDFSESSDADWSSFKEALMEITVLSPEPAGSSPPPQNQTINYLSSTTDHTDFPSTKSLISAMLSDIDELSSSAVEDNKEGSDSEEGNPDVDEIIRRIRAEKLKVKSGAENAMLEPAESENGVGFLGLDQSSSLYKEEEEPSISEIFRVWDLGISKDVDEFIAQMNKELIEDPLTTLPSTSVGSWPHSMKEPMDELVAGFSDLNLS